MVEIFYGFRSVDEFLMIVGEILPPHLYKINQSTASLMSDKIHDTRLVIACFYEEISH